MEFRKVTVSLPERLYKESMNMVKQGLFANISDVIRSGMRQQLKTHQQLSDEFDEKYLYSDKKLIAAVRKSEQEFKEGKGIRFKNVKEMTKWLEEL